MPLPYWIVFLVIWYSLRLALTQFLRLWAIKKIAKLAKNNEEVWELKSGYIFVMVSEICRTHKIPLPKVYLFERLRTGLLNIDKIGCALAIPSIFLGVPSIICIPNSYFDRFGGLFIQEVDWAVAHEIGHLRLSNQLLRYIPLMKIAGEINADAFAAKIFGNKPGIRILEKLDYDDYGFLSPMTVKRIEALRALEQT